MAVVDQLEAVEVDEEYGHRVPGAHAAEQGVLQPLEEEEAVREAGQGIVQGAAVELLGRVLELGPGLGVGQVGHGDVGQRLRRFHVARAERPRAVPVQVEGPELAAVVPQREGEHRGEPGGERGRPERRERVRAAQVGHGDRLPRLVRAEAGTLADLGLQLLEAQRRIIGGGDVVGAGGRGDQGDPGSGDRQDVDDAPDEVVQDALDREVGGHGASELAENVCQLPVRCHNNRSFATPRSPLLGYRAQRRQRTC